MGGGWGPLEHINPVHEYLVWYGIRRLVGFIESAGVLISDQREKLAAELSLTVGWWMDGCTASSRHGNFKDHKKQIKSNSFREKKLIYCNRKFILENCNENNKF